MVVLLVLQFVQLCVSDGVDEIEPEARGRKRGGRVRNDLFGGQRPRLQQLADEGVDGSGRT